MPRQFCTISMFSPLLKTIAESAKLTYTLVNSQQRMMLIMVAFSVYELKIQVRYPVPEISFGSTGQHFVGQPSSNHTSYLSQVPQSRMWMNFRQMWRNLKFCQILRNFKVHHMKDVKKLDNSKLGSTQQQKIC